MLRFRQDSNGIWQPYRTDDNKSESKSDINAEPTKKAGRPKKQDVGENEKS